MRQTTKALAVAALAVVTCWTSDSRAAFSSYPRALEVQLNRIGFEKPALAPMAHTVFCLRYKEDCEVRGQCRSDTSDSRAAGMKESARQSPSILRSARSASRNADSAGNDQAMWRNCPRHW